MRHVIIASVALIIFSSAARGQSTGRSPLVPGSGKPRSVIQTPLAGGVVERLDIELPPGRHNFQPRLALSYSSMGDLADVGLGWSLDAGKIERSTKNGVPAFTADDLFVFSVGGGGSELVSVGGGHYRASTESEYRDFQFFGDHWEMRDAGGTLYRFGTTSASRTADATWMMDAAQDTNGNTVTMSYTADGGFLYLSELRYTGHAPTADPGVDHVSFEYEARPDTRVRYNLATRQDRNLRLSRISVFAGSFLVRRYELQYATSPANGRSRITGIDLVGSDDSSRVPARRYGYTERTLGWNGTALGSGPPLDFNDADGKDLGLRAVDVNGDNLADLVENGASVRLGDGTGTFTHSSSWSTSAAATSVSFVDGDGVDTGGRLLDVNGDLRPDLIFATESRHDVYLNDGTGWVHDTGYSASLDSLDASASAPRIYFEPDCTPAADADPGEPNCNDLITFTLPFSLVRPNGDASGSYFGDVNGDGLTDIVWYMRSTDVLFGFDPGTGSTIGYVPILVQSVLLNTGSGWARSGALSTALGTVATPFVVDAKVQAYDLIDVNGDGLADIVHTKSGDRQVYLNTGTGWTNDATYTASLLATSIVSIDADKPQGVLPADLNGDGLPDFIRADEGTQIAYRNTGAGWVSDSTLTANLAALSITLADADGKPQGYVLGDVDGDGLLDLLRGHDGTRSIRTVIGPHGDLLASATTALGETTAVTWGVSSQFDNDGGDAIEDLPLVLPVSLSLTRGDGRGNSFTSTVSYQGGLFEKDGGYRGFAVVDTTDSRGVVERVSQIQSGVLAGSISSMDILDGATLLSRKSMAYATTSPVAGVTQVQLVQTDDETFDAGGSTHTRTRMDYDTYLNIAVVHKDGDVGVSGDEARTEIAHAVNLTAGIVGLPSRISIYDAGGALVSQTVILYDGQAEGAVLVGNPTSTVDSIEIGGATSTRSSSYDAYGNVVGVSDRQGSAATFSYDGVRHSYRVGAVDPAGREVSSDFDVRYGQVKLDVDANGHATTRDFDAFGRLVREVEPGDECSPNGTVSVAYSALGSPTSQHLTVLATELPGQPDTFDSVSYFDGFGQVWRIESEGDGGRTVRVDTEYDDAGNARSVTRPYFAGDPAPTTTFARDALRRSIRTVDPDGIPHDISYAGSRSQVTDKRGNQVELDYDAYRHVVQVTQHDGSNTIVTGYRYDSFGRPIEVTNALGEVTTLGYDAMGRRTFVDDPALGRTDYQLDVAGKLIRQTDAAGRTIEMSYNANSELTRKDLSTGEIVEYFYDGAPGTNSTGRVAAINDGAGEIELAYDPRGHVRERRRTIDGQTYVTGYHYDSMNRLRQVDYPDGFKVFYRYGQGGYVDRVSGSDGRIIVDSIVYDAAGRIVDIRYGNGVDSVYGYDAAEQLATTHTANAGGDVLQDLGYAYDTVGNVTAIVDAAFNRSQSFEYDDLNRITRAEGSYGEELYEYDALGNLLRRGNVLMAIDPDRRQRTTCGIDLSLLSAPGNGVVHNPHLFTCAGLLMDPSSGHGPDERAAIGVIRAQGIWHNKHIGQSFSVDYDDVGNVVRKNSQTYEYDAENHLLRILEGNGQLTEENVYDSNGQRVIQRTQGNQQRLFIDDLFEVDQSHASRHVRLGRMLVATSVIPRAQVELITHAADDGLTTCETGTTPPTGGPCAATIGLPGNGAPFGPPLVVVALWALIGFARRAGRRIARALRPIARQAAAHPVAAALAAILAGLLAFQTTWGQVAHAAPPPGAGSEHRFFYHADHVGSTNVVTDERGAEMERREYTPFGEQVVRTGAEGGPRLLEISYQGQRFDDASGLYYFHARHYDPVLGRFLSADSQVPDPTNPQALHRYAFNSNNPIRYADPTGHGFFDILLAIVLVILVIVAVVITFIPGVGTAVGPFLAAVALGALIGLAAGVVVGIIVGIVLLATGTIHGADEFFAVVGGFAVIGFLVGAAIGALVAGGAAAAATVAVKLGTTTLVGAAGGAIGGAANFAVNGGTPGQFLSAVLIGAGVGAVVGFVSGASALGVAATGSVGATPTAGIIGKLATVGGVLVGAGFAGYAGYQAADYCRTHSCSPLDQTGATSFGDTGAAGALGPKGALADFVEDSRGVPHWTFLGTLVHRFLAYDVEGRQDLRDLFNVYPLAP